MPCHCHRRGIIICCIQHFEILNSGIILKTFTHAYAQKPLMNAMLGAYLAWLQASIVVRAFNYIHTLCMREVKALVNLPICAVSPECVLIDNAISTRISRAGPYAFADIGIAPITQLRTCVIK